MTPVMPLDAAPLRLISSMATRGLLQALAPALTRAVGVPVSIESVGGVDAARRVAAGEPFDVVMLAREALERLAAQGHVRGDSIRDVVHSGVAVAVPAGQPLPSLATEQALQEALCAAPAIAYSTGPSGTALLALFERWGLTGTLRDRLVQAPPGVPVAQLLAEKRAVLGFQQLSELLGAPGITIVGPLPPPVQITTCFAAAVALTTTREAVAAGVVAALGDPSTAPLKRQHGMEACVDASGASGPLGDRA